MLATTALSRAAVSLSDPAFPLEMKISASSPPPKRTDSAGIAQATDFEVEGFGRAAVRQAAAGHRVHGQAPSERNLVAEVIRAGLLARGRLVLFRFDREAQIFLAVLRSAHPAAYPILGALAVDRAAVVAVLVVVWVLVVVPEQRAFVGVVVVHFRFSSAQGDRHRWCAEAPGDFVDESFGGGRMRVHLAALSFSAAAHTAFAAAGAAGYKPRLRSSRSNASKPARPRERTKPRHARPS